MSIVRVTKEFKLEIAHALWNYDGKCKNIHGHSYRLFVTVIGSPISDKLNPKLGMVIDFGDLKKIINDKVVSKFDHALVLNSESDNNELLQKNQMFERCILVDFQPTCENMVMDFANTINNLLPANLKLYSVKLYETATSYAEWYGSDNQ